MFVNLNSRWRAGHRWWLTAATVCLLPLCGCMCQKGVELRGNWALQLNHVPWCQHETDCRDACASGEVGPVLDNGAHGAPGPQGPAPVHRFHPVPMAPVVAPPVASADALPAHDALSADDATADAPAPPLASEPVSVLKPYTGASEPAWVFRNRPSGGVQQRTADRRRLGSGWESSPSRR